MVMMAVMMLVKDNSIVLTNSCPLRYLVRKAVLLAKDDTKLGWWDRTHIHACVPALRHTTNNTTAAATRLPSCHARSCHPIPILPPPHAGGAVASLLINITPAGMERRG